MQSNHIQIFHQTKPLINLINLDLSNNVLTSFILDMKDLLPKIITVSLENNTLMDFQPIDSNLNHTLNHLNLNGNQIRNINAYQWILKNRNITSWKDNFPICDCSSEGTLKKLNKEKIVHKCILPLPGDVHVQIHLFTCPSTDRRDSSCTYFGSLYLCFFTKKRFYVIIEMLKQNFQLQFHHLLRQFSIARMPFGRPQ